MKRSLLAVMLFGFAAALHASEPPCPNAVNTFLAAPSERSLRAVQQSGCASLITSSNANLARLNKLVRQGNQWSAELSARNLKSLDGGNLEDTLVALGEFSERNMERFLMFGKEGIMSERTLTEAVTMLPLSLVDQPAAQLKRIGVRRNKAAAVSGGTVAKQRREVLKALDDFATEIRSRGATR